MEANAFRRYIVACWTACAVLYAGGASTYYVIDLSGGPNADSYPMEIIDGEPSGGWTTEHKTTKLVLRRIEAGSFKMCNQVDVTLTRPFFIGVFEVTSAQYAKVMGGSDNDACPKAGISYNMIRGNSSTYSWPGSANVDPSTFIGKLRKKTSILTIDLPTEAQWEYACRAGTTSEYNNGGNTENDLKQVGRYLGNGDDERGGDEYYYTETIVGSYDPNAWGLYDMHGNVREWCLDYQGSLTGGINPVGETTGNWRVMRGGGYESAAQNCGASYRDSNNPGSAAGYDGFRIACFPAEIVHSSTPYEGVYDGQGHGIEVDVDMPTNAAISYALLENGPYQAEPILFTNATDGAVTVWYKVEANGYDTVASNCTVTITKATYDMTEVEWVYYDMSGVAWVYNKPFDGDGTEKKIVLTNLPTGVSATYTGNKATAPGTNTAHAVLSYDAVNYLEPVVADLTWVIRPPMELGVEQIVGYPTTVGSNGLGRVEGIVDTTASSLRSVQLAGETNDEAAVWFEVVVTNVTSVSFDWKCSCEELGKKRTPYDYLEFSIDSTRAAYIGGETDWTNMTFDVEEGVEHVFRWTYSKDDMTTEGDDCAWVANIVITYAQEPEIRFTSISTEEGTVTVAVSMMLGDSAQAISSAEVKNWLEATSNLSDWVGGALPITVTDLTEGVAETVRFRVEFPNGAPPRAFLRIRKP